MKHQKLIDFRRGINALAKQNGWLVEWSESSGPSQRMIIYRKNGHKLEVIDTAIIRADVKEVSPAVGRAMIRKLRSRIAIEIAKTTVDDVPNQLQTLIDWLTTWFQ